MMIPKIIHCCWFGGPKTKLAENCLASWRRFAPDWKIVEWKLEDLPASRFLDKAVSLKKWAAVSDWVRMWAMKECGGVYFDYDVELLQGIDDLAEFEWFAEEPHPHVGTQIALGLGMALEKGSPIAVHMLELYEESGFDPAVDMMGVITGNLKKVLARVDRRPHIFPPEVFCPLSSDGKMRRTEQTRAIHWYAMSWASPQRKLARWFGWHGMGGLVKSLLTLRNRVRGWHKRIRHVCATGNRENG